MEESKQLLFQAATLWEHIGERRFYVGPEGVMVPPETFFAAFYLDSCALPSGRP